MRWLISVVLISCTTHAAYVVNNAGRQINGSEISASADGSITLKMANGQMMTFQKGQYKSAAAGRPKELDIAEKLIREDQGDKAVPFLKLAKKKCRYLKWDQKAIQLLADHYFESGQFKLAVDEFQLMENQGVPENRRRLREAMMLSGEKDSVLAMLNEDIGSGSREAAAQAYVMRGMHRFDHGDVEGARRDWMKVTTFFKTQKDEVQKAEELLKENEG